MPPDKTLLSMLLEEDETRPMSFADIMQSFGMNDRNTGWRNTWKKLLQDGHIEPLQEGKGPLFTSPYQLTGSGLELVATDEFKQSLLGKTKSTLRPKTNEELHERIKKKLMNNRGIQIFDLLHNRGPMSRMDLAKALEISDRGAYFSYALQQLKDLGYVEIDSSRACAAKKNKKLRLTEKAYIGEAPNKKEVSTMGCKEEEESKARDIAVTKEGDDKV